MWKQSDLQHIESCHFSVTRIGFPVLASSRLFLVSHLLWNTGNQQGQHERREAAHPKPVAITSRVPLPINLGATVTVPIIIGLCP